MLLARHPEGLTGDELLCALYEDESVTPVTLRAELARLRRVLGPGLLCLAALPAGGRRSSPMWLSSSGGWRAGAVTAAATAYAGPLLPGSQAPAVVRLRHRLADGLRTALIARRDPDLLADWAHAPWGEDDLDVWRALAAVRPTAAGPGAPDRAGGRVGGTGRRGHAGTGRRGAAPVRSRERPHPIPHASAPAQRTCNVPLPSLRAESCPTAGSALPGGRPA